ncbi:MAG: DEAD/DEAH box helicase [Verrucomicrobia bacterium]|nr:DEAD/DEAH box helicase [Verrucomicrobiota bacterium]
MNDPIGTFNRIRDNFILYVKTAFRTQYPSLETERETLLRATAENEPGIFYRDPWIEPLPRYQQARPVQDLTAEDLPGLDANTSAAFKELAQCGLVGNYALYSHQLEMLQLSLCGRNAVVTAGTGSGKTESFLLPLFASLAREAITWPAPGPRQTHQDDWWTPANETWRAQQDANGLSPRVSQRSNETRKAAVRALIMYPMNALVEDQMTRLRKALDSQRARDWLHENCNRNRIYLGRYNGGTPVPGHEFKQDGTPNEQKISDLISELQKADEAVRVVDQHIQENRANERSQEARYFFPRLDGGEMRCRWDMQDAPPDILITNNSMLSIMLMRADDDGIFTNTREWLAESPDNVFHLILDELHLYRGTAGTEVAFLVRLLINRLGLSPESPQLRLLASSASLDPGNPKSLAFLNGFFGCEWTAEQIVVGRHRILPPARTEQIRADEFAALCDAFDSRESGVINRAVDNLCAAVGAATGGDAREAAARAFSQISTNAIVSCSSDGSQENVRAAALSQIANRFFSATADEALRVKGLRGLFILRGMAAQGADLPAFRFHWFFRNIEGLWACVAPNHGRQHDPNDSRTAGKLFGSSRIFYADEQGDARRVLELLYCEVCGTSFFGGSKLPILNNGGWELLNTDHDIEGIPDRQAARFVDRRSFAEYGIFWPTGNRAINPDATGTWTQHLLKDEAAGSQVASWRAGARWRPAALNPYNGRVQLGSATGDAIPGYLFVSGTLNGNEQSQLSALPSMCPCCASNYTRRISRKSPIRGFRTGFSKVSQILAKELFYELPSIDRKLVVFSDSREDAAGVSNGIERNHYDDLIREVVYDELMHEAFGEFSLLEDIANDGRPVSPEAIACDARNSTTRARIEEDLLLERTEIPDALPQVQRRLLDDAKNAACARLAALRHRGQTRRIPAEILLFDRDDNRGPGLLIKRLKSLGVNPAGVDVLYQEFKYATNDWRRWTELFDFSRPDTCWQIEGVDAPIVERRLNHLVPKVAAEVSGVLFSRNYFSFESCGLGFPHIRLTEEQAATLAAECNCASDLFLQVCNGFIRILGDLFRYVDNSVGAWRIEEWTAPADARARIQIWFQEVAAANPPLDAQRLRDTVWTAVTDTRYGQNSHAILNLLRLDIQIATPQQSVWTCRSCRRPHLHRAGGVCTWCNERLDENPDTTCESLRENNYYAAEVTQRRQPLRMHCEELTAQTDDQPERQRLFRDIVINVGSNQRRRLVAAVDTIDLLSVTTTMEVGVDIGGLQAVMLANMPPMRFNYQQRVGRAGRRGQAFAAVLTVCRGRSHDEHYYNAPARITGDQPPVPFLSLDRPEIAQRLVAKECLRRAFAAVGITTWDSPVPPDSHGEFGAVQLWTDQLRDQLQAWLVSSPEVDEVISALIPQTNAPGLEANLRNYVRTSLVNRVAECVQNDALGGQGIAQRLAEGAVLPMFGMPSRTRQLYHGFDFDRNREPKTIDRDLDLAITEFAPGSQKTKDKRIYTAIGFTAPLLLRRGRLTPASDNPLPWRRWMQHCLRCHYTATAPVQPADTLCPFCGASANDPQPFTVFLVAAPAAFRTSFDRGQDARVDGELNLGSATILSEESNASATQPADTNTAVRLDRNGMVYRMNDRNRKMFQGGHGSAAQGNWAFDDQWIDHRFQNPQQPAAGALLPGVTFTRTASANDLNDFALVAPKTTDVLRISPAHIPLGLRLDPLVTGGSVKGAFYSAAFIIRSVAADLMDIDAEEIVVSNVRQRPMPTGERVGEIVLNDFLPNGSGFVAWISENWSDLLRATLQASRDGFVRTMLSASHRRRCETSCPDCLRHYRNMAYHGLLDWRLGLGVVRLLADSSYQSGLVDVDVPELRGPNGGQSWISNAERLRDSFCRAFPQCAPRPFAELPGFTLRGREIIIVHPLWNTQSPHGRLADALAVCTTPLPLFLDTFNIVRRMSHAYQTLAAQL